MQKGSRIGIVGCSNGQTKEYEEKIEYLIGIITNEIGFCLLYTSDAADE